MLAGTLVSYTCAVPGTNVPRPAVRALETLSTAGTTRPPLAARGPPPRRADAVVRGREQQLGHVRRVGRIPLVLRQHEHRMPVRAVDVHRPDVRARGAGPVRAPVQQPGAVREPCGLARLRAVGG